MKTIIIACVLAITGILFAFSGCVENKSREIFLLDKNLILVLNDAAFSTAEIHAGVTEDGKEVQRNIAYSVSDGRVIQAEGNKITACGKGSADVVLKCGSAEERVRVQVLETLSAMDVTDEGKLNYYGRTFEREGSMVFNNTASGFEVSFIGTKISGRIESVGQGSLKVWLDGEIRGTVSQNSSENHVFAEGLPRGIHTVKVMKMTEQGYFKTALSALETDGIFLSPVEKPSLKLEFYGDSITSGFGNLGDRGLVETEHYLNEDGTDTYATKTTEMLGAQASIISYSGISACLPTKNASITMLDIYDKPYADSSEKWDFSKYAADAVIVSLGTNDANAGGLDGEMYAGYKSLLEKLHAAQPNAAIICIYGMMGVNRYIYREMIKAINEMAEEGVNIVYSAILANSLGDKDHPDLKGHETAAGQLKELIEGSLKK